jgi:tRNA(Ile)-lysidine synthase
MPRRPPAVARVLTQVTGTVRRHELIAPGDLTLVMVSGGPDSVCLLYSLWHLRRLLRNHLAAFHFDHRLRRDSTKDADYVGRVCERLGVPLHIRQADEQPPKGASVEAWARGVRVNAANDVRREIGAVSLAEAHTVDDQAESVLINLFRGTGIEGLAGIDPGGHGSVWIHPLLDVTRADVEAFCGALHLRPRRDPMNEDRRYLRPSIRHDVLPFIEEATGRDVKASIARTADTLRRDRDELWQATGRTYLDIAEESGDEIRFRAAGLLALSEPVAARVIRFGAYQALSVDAPAPWTKAGIDAILDLARGRPGRRRDLADGRVASRDRTHVVVARADHGGHTDDHTDDHIDG